MRIVPPAAFFAATIALLLFGSCVSEASRQIIIPPEVSQITQGPLPYAITDHKNKTGGGGIPEWVNLALASGERGVETLDAFTGRFVFVARNQANNFGALNLWKDGFSAELDFPRLAAARIEARFSYAVPNPDVSYGAFFETMIRAASDFPWTGAIRVDDFWTLRKFQSDEEPGGDAGEDFISEGNAASDSNGQETENWEMLILVTIERTLFASQFDQIFQNVNPSPPPSRDQRTTINRVKDRFFEGF